MPLPDKTAHEMVVWLLNELLDREDVRDGAEGQPMPNEAMSMLTHFEEHFGLAVRSIVRETPDAG